MRRLAAASAVVVLAAGLLSGCGASTTQSTAGDDSGQAFGRRLSAAYRRIAAVESRVLLDYPSGLRLRSYALSVAPTGTVEKLVGISTVLRESRSDGDLPKGAVVYAVTDLAAERTYTRVDTPGEPPGCWTSEPMDDYWRGMGGQPFIPANPPKGMFDAPRRSGRFLILRLHDADGSVSDLRIDPRTLHVIDQTEVEPSSDPELGVPVGINRWRNYAKVPPIPAIRPLCE